MYPKVYKHTIEITLLSAHPTIQNTIGGFLTLANINYAMNYGDCVGTYDYTDTQEVPPENVQAELLAVGNDGSFFLLLDDADDDDVTETTGNYSDSMDERFEGRMLALLSEHRLEELWHHLVDRFKNKKLYDEFYLLKTTLEDQLDRLEASLTTKLQSRATPGEQVW